MNIRVLSIRVLALLFLGSVILPASAQNDDAGDKRRLLAVWRGGFPDDSKPTIEVVITAEEITAKDLKNGNSIGKGTYKLGADPTGKTIDATGTAGPIKGGTYLGRYALEGDTLKWCSTHGRGNRPAGLVHKPGALQSLLILRRQ